MPDATLAELQAHVDTARDALAEAVSLRNSAIRAAHNAGMSLRTISAELSGGVGPSGIRYILLGSD